MQTTLEWIHHLRLIAHRHPNGPAWIQGVGSMAAVLVAVVIFWRQGRAREKERQDDNRIRQEREAEDDRIRRAREAKDDQIRRSQESKAQADRHMQQWSASRIAANDRLVRKKTLLVIVWPMIVQTRSRMAFVLNTLRRSAQQAPSFSGGHEFYIDYEVGSLYEWEKVEREVFIFGSDIAVAIHEMLAIIRQNDKDTARLRQGNAPVDYKMHMNFLVNAKEHADRAITLLEDEYEKALGIKPKRAIFWARSAKAAASQAERRKGSGLEVEEP